MDAAAALGALAADKMVEIVRRGGSLRRLRERGAAPYLVCSTQRMIGGGSARAADRTFVGVCRAGYGRESGVCLVDLAQAVPPTKCDAGAGLFKSVHSKI
jgi:hypothetical protein